VFTTSPAYAGGGAENAAVVVNADSWASMTIANEYIHLRNIPACNVVYLNLGDTINFFESDVDTFRSKILIPVLMTLRERQLIGQIDYIMYSSDIPYAISIQSDLGSQKLPYLAKPVASLTALTYLNRSVLKKEMEYVSLTSNRYARNAIPLKEPSAAPTVPGNQQAPTWGPTMGFQSVKLWDKQGMVDHTGQGDTYMLSTMLGWTSGRGNSVNEVLDCLRRSVAADDTFPKGTVYLVENSDLRTTIRKWAFGQTVELLGERGFSAEVFQG
jgi:hypothetical protein